MLWCMTSIQITFKWPANASHKTHRAPIKNTNWLIRCREISLVRGTAFGITTRLRAGRSGVRILADTRHSFLATRRDRLCRPPSVPSNGYRGPFPSVKRRSVNLNTHRHLAPRLKISGAIPLLPYTPSWRTQGQLYFYCIIQTPMCKEF
jgi:hypothetical protein